MKYSLVYPAWNPKVTLTLPIPVVTLAKGQYDLRSKRCDVSEAKATENKKRGAHELEWCLLLRKLMLHYSQH